MTKYPNKFAPFLNSLYLCTPIIYLYIKYERKDIEDFKIR